MESEGTPRQDAPQCQEGMRCHRVGGHRVLVTQAGIHRRQKHEQRLSPRVSYEAQQRRKPKHGSPQKEGRHSPRQSFGS